MDKKNSSHNTHTSQTQRGLFGLREDYLEKYQSLDQRFIKNRASTFFFEAKSDAMRPLIFEKDVLIVDRSLDLRNGQVAIFSLDGEMFCKRIFKRPHTLILKSENPAYKDINVKKEQDFSLFGVVVGIARDLI